jgi:hypothetical protein
MPVGFQPFVNDQDDGANLQLLGLSLNTVHFTILMAAAKSIQAVGWGRRGRSL